MHAHAQRQERGCFLKLHLMAVYLKCAQFLDGVNWNETLFAFVRLCDRWPGSPKNGVCQPKMFCQIKLNIHAQYCKCVLLLYLVVTYIQIVIVVVWKATNRRNSWTQKMVARKVLFIYIYTQVHTRWDRRDVGTSGHRKVNFITTFHTVQRLNEHENVLFCFLLFACKLQECLRGEGVSAWYWGWTRTATRRLLHYLHNPMPHPPYPAIRVVMGRRTEEIKKKKAISLTCACCHDR